MLNESERARLVTQYLRQFQVHEPIGKNSCYPTSILNCAIALGLLKSEYARLIHEDLVLELARNHELWNGGNMHIETLDPRIAEIIESYIPRLQIGFMVEGGIRLLTVHRTFEQIRHDLYIGYPLHTVIAPQARHASALVRFDIQGVGYVDPMDPYTTHLGNKAWFGQVFQADQAGEVITTPLYIRR